MIPGVRENSQGLEVTMLGVGVKLQIFREMIPGIGIMIPIFVKIIPEFGIIFAGFREMIPGVRVKSQELE